MFTCTQTEDTFFSSLYALLLGWLSCLNSLGVASCLANCPTRIVRLVDFDSPRGFAHFTSLTLCTALAPSARQNKLFNLARMETPLLLLLLCLFFLFNVSFACAATSLLLWVPRSCDTRRLRRDSACLKPRRVETAAAERKTYRKR